LIAFLDLTPTFGVAIENPLLGKSYPSEGEVVAVVDTGYEGFVALPRDIFHRAAFDELQLERRSVLLADGSSLSSEGTYGTLVVPDVSLKADGFIETYGGLDEVIIGTEALSNLRLVLDYCLRRLHAEKYP